jgi:hypothetical protein
MNGLLSSILMLAFVTYACGAFTTNCLKCIREVENGKVGVCNMDQGTLSCGPYQIKRLYYQDCYSPGTGWQKCTRQTECSEICVHAYLNRWGRVCTGGRTPTCQDYARIHNGGPTGCTKPGTIGYWNLINNCCTRIGGC